MKISILVCVGNERHGPVDRGDCWDEAIASFVDLADEVVVVSGNKEFAETFVSPSGKVKMHYLAWPWEFDWIELPKHLNYGLDKCTGDWVIRCDIDYVFHEKDLTEIRRRLAALHNFPVVTFQKYSFVLHNKFYQKGAVPLAINRRHKDKCFGRATNQRTDMCYPIVRTGIGKDGVPEGLYEPDTFGKIGLPVYNYDYSFKTRVQTQEEFWRFAKAFRKTYGEWQFGDTEARAFNVFIDMMTGRLKKCPYTMGDGYTHPKYIKDKIHNLNQEQFAHSGWGEIGR